jgi:hypothetical protein
MIGSTIDDSPRVNTPGHHGMGDDENTSATPR